jgi:hypothetical protein
MNAANDDTPGRLTLDVIHHWNGLQRAGREPAVVFELRADPSGYLIEIDALYHFDPAPPHPPGSCDGLWQFEVVELFIATAAEPGADVNAGRYLELEFGPHGHYLALQFGGYRERAGGPLPLDYRVTTANIGEGLRWRAEAVVPFGYVPPAPHRLNAFAVFGVTPRCYLAHAPATGTRPDFHRLGSFVPLVLPQPSKRSR